MPDFATNLLLTGFALGAAAPLFILLFFIRGDAWHRKFGPPNWTFRSYATNLAVAGGFITSVVVSQAMGSDSAQQRLFLALSLCTNIMAGAAPIVYLMWYSTGPPLTPISTPPVQGHLVPFLLASALSSAAAFSQLLVLAELLRALHTLKAALPLAAVYVMWCVLALAGLAMFLYTFRTIQLYTVAEEPVKSSAIVPAGARAKPNAVVRPEGLPLL